MSSATILPEVVEADDVTTWSDEADVVVIGFGIAGGCAAVAAAEAGARVLVLERAAEAGGTTALAGGHFYLGGGTPVQQATGHPDSARQMYDYLVAVSPDPDHAKIRAYCEGSVEHFTWLEDLGFRFERSYFPGKAVIQPHTEGLMYTGNEKVWPFCTETAPAPRGHKVPVAGDTGGARMVVDLLLKRAASLGVQTRYETGATGLVRRGGDLVGTTWRRYEESGAVRAGAVVIAAGGFIMNSEMVAHHIPQLKTTPMALGNTYDDGLGIRLGMSAGAAARDMDKVFITAPVYPPGILLTGLIVNNQGHRFVAEDSYHARTSAFVMEQPDSTAFLIVDEAHLQMPRMPLVPLIDGWETPADMEKALGIPSGNLCATLQRYNTCAAMGQDPDFHKQPEFLAAQHRGPWGAFDLSLGTAAYSAFTLGGLTTTVDGRVLRADTSPIAGLYAVGACASNIAIDGKSYASGTQLGEGSFFGRRAGAHAAHSAGTPAA